MTCLLVCKVLLLKILFAICFWQIFACNLLGKLWAGALGSTTFSSIYPWRCQRAFQARWWLKYSLYDRTDHSNKVISVVYLPLVILKLERVCRKYFSNSVVINCMEPVQRRKKSNRIVCSVFAAFCWLCRMNPCSRSQEDLTCSDTLPFPRVLPMFLSGFCIISVRKHSNQGNCPLVKRFFFFPIALFFPPFTLLHFCPFLDAFKTVIRMIGFFS